MIDETRLYENISIMVKKKHFSGFLRGDEKNGTNAFDFK